MKKENLIGCLTGLMLYIVIAFLMSKLGGCLNRLNTEAYREKTEPETETVYISSRADDDEQREYWRDRIEEDIHNDARDYVEYLKFEDVEDALIEYMGDDYYEFRDMYFEIYSERDIVDEVIGYD